MMKRLLLLATTMLSMAYVALAEVTLPHIFSDHMVLQQKKPIPIWGKAEPGEAVTVTFDAQTMKTVADAQGNWTVHLQAIEAKAGQDGGTLTITGKNTVSFKDVLVGEVWFCSGQSNMKFSVKAANNGEQEVAGAQFPQLRLFTVPDKISLTPREDCGGAWEVCSPTTIPFFSAVGYFFGRALQQELKVPIGLINASWEGTVAEAWTSAPALQANFHEFKEQLDLVATKRSSEQKAKIVTEFRQQYAQREKALRTMFNIEDDVASAGKTAAADLDDSQWKTMPLPNDYKTQGLSDVDGIIWFRKTIEVPAAWTGKEIILRPGPIDDVDKTWFNGILVGGLGRSRSEESFWDVPREYHVPGTAVKAGKNVVAIRVSNSEGIGGLWEAVADSMYAELADGTDKTHLPLAGDWRYFVEFSLPVLPPYPYDQNNPSVLFNAMINPLIPYALQGVVWYQGEDNAGRARQYRTLLPTLISDWRTRWQEGDFTFLIVQEANYMARTGAPVENGWPELREAQALTAATVPKVGLAVAIDIGEAKDIHPRDKQDVGLRLSLAARKIAYGQQIAFSGPVFDKMTVENDKAALTFNYTDGGLTVKGDPLKGFAIRGKDTPFVMAQAKIDGNRVIVWADGVTQPTAIRYAWANNPECNLYNGAGLPAVPFRTDVQ